VKGPAFILDKSMSQVNTGSTLLVFYAQYLVNMRRAFRQTCWGHWEAHGQHDGRPQQWTESPPTIEVMAARRPRVAPGPPSLASHGQIAPGNRACIDSSGGRVHHDGVLMVPRG
jgi:hypothetical protein